MEYTTEIIIELPRSRVVELFKNPDYIAKWQDSFISMKHLSGEPGMAGAKSLLKYKMGKRDIEMTETIINNTLPDKFSTTYTTKGVFNSVDNTFYEEGDKTRWVTENYFKCKGMMAVMIFLMPGAFKKETKKYMADFKAFAEKLYPNT